MIFLIASSIATTLYGDIAEAYLDASVGYRRDHLSAEIYSFDENNLTISKDHLTAKDLSLYQVGGKGLIGVCDCFVRGEGYWGFSGDGVYREASQKAQKFLFKSKGNLHHGITKDFIVGAGFFLSCLVPFEMGPVAGWSYQSQEFKVKKGRLSQDDGGRGFRYSNHWQGPWLGVDAKFDCFFFTARSGYSYHWAKWNAHWSLKNRRDQRFTFQENSKSSDANGQVLYADLFWGFCPFINFGLGLKWQQWQAKKGRKKSLKSEKIGIVNDKVKIAKDQIQDAKWESCSVSLDLGISF